MVIWREARSTADSPRLFFSATRVAAPHSRLLQPLHVLTRVRIVNGVAHGRGSTSLRNAERYVAQGRAAWVTLGEVIRFLETDYRHRSALRAGDGFNPSGLALVDELRGVPFAGDVRKLLHVRTR